MKSKQLLNLFVKKPFANFAAIPVTYRVKTLEGHN